MNIYNFRRISFGPDQNSYFHENFVRGRPELISQIQRMESKGNVERYTAHPGGIGSTTESHPTSSVIPYGAPPDVTSLTENQQLLSSLQQNAAIQQLALQILRQNVVINGPSNVSHMSGIQISNPTVGTALTTTHQAMDNARNYLQQMQSSVMTSNSRNIQETLLLSTTPTSPMQSHIAPSLPFLASSNILSSFMNQPHHPNPTNIEGSASDSENNIQTLSSNAPMTAGSTLESSATPSGTPSDITSLTTNQQSLSLVQQNASIQQLALQLLGQNVVINGPSNVSHIPGIQTANPTVGTASTRTHQAMDNARNDLQHMQSNVTTSITRNIQETPTRLQSFLSAASTSQRQSHVAPSLPSLASSSILTSFLNQPHHPQPSPSICGSASGSENNIQIHSSTAPLVNSGMQHLSTLSLNSSDSPSATNNALNQGFQPPLSANYVPNFASDNILMQLLNSAHNSVSAVGVFPSRLTSNSIPNQQNSTVLNHQQQPIVEAVCGLLPTNHQGGETPTLDRRSVERVEQSEVRKSDNTVARRK